MMPFLDDASAERLSDCEYENFWATHPKILETLENEVREEVLCNTERRLEEMREKQYTFLQEVEIPLTRKRGFARGVMTVHL